ncbi:MAG TPA: DNA translocase FtsK [Acidobacteriota bacterium]|jgi:S-DNA-T family DNA segregation ATPase FtsK/SpoIIIE|nr:DNA translocase FtsK [Acidobacteriota bacterium]
MSNVQTWKKHRFNEMLGIVAWSASLLVFICLLTYDAYDPSWNVTATREVYQNSVGKFGAHVADTLFQFFGYAAFLIPLPLVVVGYKKIRSREIEANYSRAIGVFLMLLTTATIFEFLEPHWLRIANFSPGGTLGIFMKHQMVSYLNVTGSIIVVSTGLVLSILLSTTLSLSALAERIENIRFPRIPFRAWRSYLSRNKQVRIKVADPVLPKLASASKEMRPTAPVKENDQREIQRALAARHSESEPSLSPVISASTVTELKKQERVIRPERKMEDFQHPSLDFLHPPDERTTVAEAELLERAEQLTRKCHEFDVLGQVEQIHPGPVVTTYEFKPEAGIKYSRLTNLVDDLCLALRAESIRIDRIPGKNTVGIEVPNHRRESIFLREIIASDVFHKSKSLLTLALGKLIHGETYISDLRKMPHLLIAGATGSGKSVALNCMVCSMLYKATPSQVKFILIDPKRLELGVYEGIPHLLTPIVTDPKRAANALGWAVTEMENRYKRLASLGVRNIDQYNSMVENDALELMDEEDGEWLPYIIVIIDELADLMMIAAKEVEESITRLAQMARAVGIHLILATQRPSVDVITGLIKANFPSRISFRVSSKIDSRTILDTNGAEQLLGLGDMLFLPPGTSRLIRIHGPYVSEKEIHNVVSFLKKQGDPHYHDEILEDREQSELDPEIGDDWNDDLYEEASRFVVEIGKASTSALQRRFRIGYGRAARLIDVMERDGIVGPADGSKPRDILKGPEYYREIDERS